jgi:hypothetical protein
MWWTLAYIDHQESCLVLWQDKGWEVFEYDRWRDYNPTLTVALDQVKDVAALKAAVKSGKRLECDVDDSGQVVAWREE